MGVRAAEAQIVNELVMLCEDGIVCVSQSQDAGGYKASFAPSQPQPTPNIAASLFSKTFSQQAHVRKRRCLRKH
jgi:hypothetical protein